MTHKLEWSGEAGFIARNKEWDARVNQRIAYAKANAERARSGQPLVKVPAHLFVQTYTEAHRINSFWHMVYGLRWEEGL